MERKIRNKWMSKAYPFFSLLLFIALVWFSPSPVNSKEYVTMHVPAITHNEASIKNINDNMTYYDERYAVIIVGLYQDKLHYQWFTNAAQQQYTVLTETYGFNKSNIYILLTLREEWADVLKINTTIINYRATEQNISMVFNSLSTTIQDDDLLYIAIISHGGDTHHLIFEKLNIGFDIWQGILAHDTYFALETDPPIHLDVTQSSIRQTRKHNQSTLDSRIFDYELKDYTKKINARRIVFLLQPCYSGGFINDLSKENTLIFTASTEGQAATASFIEYFADGLNGSAQDTNNDGQLSLIEVYEYTADLVYQWVQNHPEEYKGRKEYPLIDDNGDKRGHRYKGLLGYNPDEPTKDGYIAAQIYNLSYEVL